MAHPLKDENTILLHLASFESFLIQLVIYLLLWLWNDYTATLLSLIVGGIAMFVLILSKLVEWVDSSRVPASYYRLMWACLMAPVIAAVLGMLLKNGLSWM
ncbi:MAG: hypothetical protein R2795_01480 [Saprospiraceae bacterium]